MKTIFVSLAVMLLAAVVAPAAPTTSPAKLWVTDLAAFLNERPGEWIVGTSTDPALSAAEAESFARRDAVGPLFNKLRLRLPRSSWSVLLKRVEASLAAGDGVVDRQVTSAVRPYGTIWSGAVLVDASPARQDRLVREVERETRQQRERTAAGMAGATMIVIVVGAFYLGLNWLTRGFFRGRLLMASALIVTSGICGIAHLI
jgi:hypothetical protein